ncbi:unnamed protein product [Ilex paraguariensis]|uniref:Cupin type-1 domain-containing protein n=1 Tax=Ilex paraguariensis TaxID=185542 RepID=A0ABC8RYP5_9AQUA
MATQLLLWELGNNQPNLGRHGNAIFNDYWQASPLRALDQRVVSPGCWTRMRTSSSAPSCAIEFHCALICLTSTLSLSWCTLSKHQRVHRIHRGHILAIPAGATHWCYNDGNEDLVVIAVNDLNNPANQLDQKHRGRQTFANIFRGFDKELLTKAFNIPREIVRKMQQEDDRGLIVNVQEGMSDALFTPHWSMNAHTVVHMTGGDDQVQVIGHNGQRVMNDRVKQSDLFVNCDTPILCLHSQGRKEWLRVGVNQDD